MVPRKSEAAPDRLTPELVGAGLFALGVFLLASLIISAQHASAYIPVHVAEALRFLVGSGAYLVAIAVLGIGALALGGSVEVLNGRILAALGLFFLCFLLARHVGVPLGAEFDWAAIDRGGGVLGAALAWGTNRLLGPICTWIVMAGVLLVAAVLFTQGQVLASSSFLSRGAAAGARWLMTSAHHHSRKPPRKTAPQLETSVTTKPATPSPAAALSR
ncbi:MAG: DNA translocase FtsK 4TM domain-containing protein, partial [Candidatus Zipacnadales bacterium]